MPPLSFLFRCVAHSLSLSLSSCLRCLVLLVVWLSSLRSRFMRMFFCPSRIICGCHLCVFVCFYCSFLVFSSESLSGHDVLCRLLSRPLTSACFPCFCSFSPAVFVTGLFWFGPVYFVTTIGFVADQLRLTIVPRSPFFAFCTPKYILL